MRDKRSQFGLGFEFEIWADEMKIRETESLRESREVMVV